MDTIRQLVDRHDARTRQLLILERLSLVANHVFRRPGVHLNEVKISSHQKHSSTIFTHACSKACPSITDMSKAVA